MTQNYYEWIERYLNSDASDDEVDEDNIAPESVKDEQVDIGSVINSVVGGDKVSVSYDTVDDAITIDTSALDRKEVENTVIPLERFNRINTNLSWEYNTLSDVPNWNSNDGGTSSWTYNINNRPRRIHVEHDGTGGSDDYGGVMADVLTTQESLGSFAITFEGVSYTDNISNNNHVAIGISSVADASVNAINSGDGLLLSNSSSSYYLYKVENSTEDISSSTSIDWSNNHDVTIEYDGSNARLLIDDSLIDELSFSENNDFRPIIQLKEESNDSASDTVEVEQVTLDLL